MNRLHNYFSRIALFALLLVVYSFCPYDLTWDLPAAKSAKSAKSGSAGVARSLSLDMQGPLPDLGFEIVDAGTLMIGATSEQGNDAYDDERPAHNVTISEFYMGRTEVTQRLWEAVMGSNPSNSKWNLRPVEMVSWNDCQQFLQRLNNMKSQLLPQDLKNWVFRLPTEAEWEYAARGGKKSRHYKYAGSNNIDEVAWYDGNSGHQTHNVKQKKANELGLYDMSGNVWEWCSDWYGSYPSYGVTNPQGASSGQYRVLRGGCWDVNARGCRVASRLSNYAPSNRGYHLGFRLVLAPR